MVDQLHRAASARRLPAPEADDAHVVVDVVAAGVNHVDLAKASGTFYTGAPPLPSVVGSDGVGRLADGRRVYFDTTRPPHGSMAEQTLVAPGTLLDVPDAIGDATAAATGNCGLAAWLSLTRRAHLAAGESSVAVQAARALGAGRVIAAARPGDRLDALLERGADATVELDPDGDPTAALREAAPAGVDVTIDLLWGAPALAAMRSAAHGARHVQLGQLAGLTVELPAPVLRAASLDLRGFAIFHEPIEHRRQAYAELGAEIAAGHLSIDTEPVPLSDIATAWQRQRDGASAKLIVIPQRASCRGRQASKPGVGYGVVVEKADRAVATIDHGDSGHRQYRLAAHASQHPVACRPQTRSWASRCAR